MRFKITFTKIVLMAERSFMQCRNKLIEAVIMLNECRILFIVILNVTMLSIIMLSVIMLNDVMLSV